MSFRAARAIDRLGALGHTELAVDVARVRLDRVEREVQLACDLALRELAAKQPQDRQLGFAESVLAGLLPPGRGAQREPSGRRSAACQALAQNARILTRGDRLQASS